MDKLALSVREAAQVVSLSPWTIRRYISDGRIRAIRIGRRVLIEPKNLLDLVEKARGEGGVNDDR